MDKNLINIDDLVRQRLGGGEEQEQAGSWGRMREMLDKEMPQRPAGMYWRRSLSALALLLLISAAGVGGYEMYSAKNKTANGINNDIAAVSGTVSSANTTNTTVADNTGSVNNTNTTTNNNAPAATENNGTAPVNNNNIKNTNDNNTNIYASGTTTEQKESHKHTAVATKHHPKSNTGDNNTDDNTVTAKTSTAVAANSTPASDNAPTAKPAGKTHKNNLVSKTDVTGVEDGKPVDKIAKADVHTTTGTAAIAATTARATHKDHKIASAAPHTKTIDAGTTTGQTTAGVTTATAVTKKDHKIAAATRHTKAIEAVAKTTNTGVEPEQSTAKKDNVTKKDNVKSLPLASGAPASTAKTALTKQDAKPTKHHTSIAKNKNTNAIANNNNNTLAVNNTPASKAIPGPDADGIADAGLVTTAGVGTKAATAHKTAAKTAAPKTTAPKTAAKKPAASKLPLAVGANGSTTSQPVAKIPRKGQRTVQRLILGQHYVKTSPTTGEFHLDTISMETVIEEYELASAPAFGPPPYDADDNQVTNTSAYAKDTRTVKKMQGNNSMENLHAAFNDIKDKVHGAHFAPGLTGGINGTFFGPNSFKGFQFGLAGNFIFSDNLNVMAEVKYFHRINNDYTLTDNYYTYTPNTGGGYTREMVSNNYTFSTLHSIEMPISVRYCTGNFNFFVGGNFVYTFAINTGAAPDPDPTTITQVKTIQNDDAAKIKDEDFNSRFGLGYLLGAGFQAAPNLMFDFRDVQTVWDNGSTTGQKIISTQLYRSPSFQLSMIYRLGGHKKDKE